MASAAEAAPSASGEAVDLEAEGAAALNSGSESQQSSTPQTPVATTALAPPATAPAGGAGWRGVLGCRRRASAGAAGALGGGAQHAAYRAAVLEGRALADEQRRRFAAMAYWSAAEVEGGARVFVLAPRGDDGDLDGGVDMWALLHYALSVMHDHVVEQRRPFALVWILAGDHRLWTCSAFRLRRTLHDAYTEKIVEFHMVHPSWAVRLIQLALWPVVSESFWDRVFCHERIEFLSSHVSIPRLQLPADIVEFDKFLDKEQQLMTEQGAMLSGGPVMQGSYR
eukprot:TRINITY_DN20112_c0_g1_i2.p1 TRINITY_DN20112_c0_g1~~TRINITY_DN20112_c0_g1_i2.p1  ORF type:complete len:294 (+),score=61.22 TRINITY_DN20112_c0_g1_i2:39-884(+)